MAVDDPLDFTPPSTFNTIQFANENVNVIALSLLIVLVLANIRSVTTKLVYYTKEDVFDYRAWVRGFIFASSEDPMRLLSWVMKKYSYRKPEWKRNPNRFRADRLRLPLLARVIVLICSIASIAITIPAQSKVEGCVGGDYRLTFNVSSASHSRFPQAICTDIPLTSGRGTVTSKASFCDCSDERQPRSESLPERGIKIIHNHDHGFLRTIVFNEEGMRTTDSYVEWKDPREKLFTYRTNLPEVLGREDHFRIVKRAIEEFGGCEVVDELRNDSEEFSSTLAVDCNFNLDDILFRTKSYLRTAMVWVKVAEPQVRIRLDGADQRNPTRDCPIQLSINQPVLNILPLVVLLITWIIINAIVSFVLIRHGNALDAGFHIVKEALGHDTTSNPLEESAVRREVNFIPLGHFLCEGGEAHVGFIRREGDVEVNEFDEHVKVGACNSANGHMEATEDLKGALRHYVGRPHDSRDVSSLGVDPQLL